MLRDAVRAVDADVPIVLSTIEARLSTSLTPRRFTLLILGFFGAASLILACVGIWGVVAYAVARRTREVGIRIALGADSGAVVRLVQTGYLGAAAVGAAIGLVLSIALTRLMRGLLFEVEPTDPLTLVAVVGALGVAAWLASFFPARRTTRVNPMVAMRAE